MKTPYFAIFCLAWATLAFSNTCESDSRTVLSPQIFPVAADDSVRAIQRQASQYPPLPREEQRELLRKYVMTGDEEILDKLVLHNLRLALKVAFKYQEAYPDHLSDIVQVGLIGLFKSIKKYDLDKGKLVEFSSYAVKYIGGYIRRYIDRKIRLVQLKVHPEKQTHFMRLKKELSQEGKNVFDERRWVAKEMGVSVDMVITMDLQLGRKSTEQGLDEPLKGTDSKTLMEVLPLDDAPPTSALPLTDPIFRKTLARFLVNYSERNRNIFLRLRYSPIPSIVRELADIHGITHQGIYAIDKKMMANLRKYMQSFNRTGL